jgi:Asp-tRNA(Asn)/Glu-tRNA(Gln) amidotransferase A subunit family amidase
LGGARSEKGAKACLRRIDRYNPVVNAFVTVARGQAIEAARQIDADRRRGAWRPLHGTPVASKDNVDTAGIRTTGASTLFKDRVPDEMPTSSRL